MQSNFAAHTQTAEGAITVALRGELDLVSAPALEQALEQALESQPQQDVELIVLDLRDLEFMDSTGLHAVLRIVGGAHDNGRRFALIRGPDQVNRLFELTGLAETLTIVDSPEQLVEGWTPPEPTVTP